jgi:hypothetical protein
LDIVNARQPDENEFSVPSDNTTLQARQLDRMLSYQEETTRTGTYSSSNTTTRRIKVKLSDAWMSMEVDVLSLLRALGLPDHDIFTRGILHGTFENVQPSDPNLPDVDHAEEPESEEVL